MPVQTYDSTDTYDNLLYPYDGTPPPPPVINTSTYVGWLAVLNQLAGTKNLGENAAANAWAGTHNLSLLSALSVKAGQKTGLYGLGTLCNMIAGTKNLSPLAALNQLAGNTGP